MCIEIWNNQVGEVLDTTATSLTNDMESIFPNLNTLLRLIDTWQLRAVNGNEVLVSSDIWT